MRRSGSCAFDEILSIDQTLREPVFRKVHSKDAFGVSQCLRAVDVLPVSVADIKGSQFLLTRKLAHAVRQRAVSIFLRCFEPAEQLWAAQKHPCIQCVITGKVFANFENKTALASDLGGVFQVKDTSQLVIDRENDLVSCEWLLQ